MVLRHFQQRYNIIAAGKASNGRHTLHLFGKSNPGCWRHNRTLEPLDYSTVPKQIIRPGQTTYFLRSESIYIVTQYTNSEPTSADSIPLMPSNNGNNVFWYDASGDRTLAVHSLGRRSIHYTTEAVLILACFVCVIVADVYHVCLV